MTDLLLITPEFPPNHTGGGGPVYKSLAKSFVEAGYNVTVISADHTLDSAINEIPETSDEGYSVYRLPLIKNLFNLQLLKAKLPLTKKSKIWLRNFFANNNFDIAISFGAIEFIGPTVTKALRRKNIPYIIDVHGYPNSTVYPFYINLLFKIFEITFLNTYFRNAQSIVEKSPDIIAGKFETVVIPNGIDIDDLTTINKPIDIREKHNIAKEKKIIFSLGRVEKNKGFHYIAQATKGMEDTIYIIGGKDNGYQEIITGISDKVIIAGELDYEEKKSYFKEADIIAVPSRIESFGLVALEAMAFQKAIVTSGVGGLKSFLRDGYNSLYIDIENPDDMRSKIQSLLNNKVLAEKLARQAYLDSQDYKWDKIEDRYIKLIEKTLVS